jgi:transcriptional regulator with XRE-family HTH domain
MLFASTVGADTTRSRALAAQSPTVRRRRLGQELRQLREDAGLTCEEVGEQLEWSGAKVSRIETAQVGVRPRDVSDLLDLYQVTDKQHRDNLLTLTREARQRGWWFPYEDMFPQRFGTWLSLEAEATSLRIYDMQVANGLLQTEEYARAVLRSVWFSETAEQIERRVALRMKRQQVLSREENPLHLWVVIDEAVLHRRVGGPDVMRAQMQRLAEVAETMPHITLQVLPFSAGAHASVDGAFTIAELTAPDPEVVSIEYRLGGLHLEQEDEVRRYTRIFDRLRATAMSPDESVELIAKLARGPRNGENGGRGEDVRS